MYCLKCGRDTEDSHIFCSACLRVMEDYPVKPGTPVVLPTRSSMAEEKKPAHRKRTLSPKEQIAKLHKYIRVLAIAVAALAVALSAAVILLFHSLQAPPVQEDVGRNYTTIDSETH